MSRYTCDDVNEQLELFALGECDTDVSTSIDDHLTNCGTCRRHAMKARRLVGLLDLHYQEPARLQHLLTRLDSEFRPRVRHRVTWPRQLVSLAALLLVAVGLALSMPTVPEGVVEPLNFATLELVRAVPAPGAKDAISRATIWTAPDKPGQHVSDGVHIVSGVVRVHVEPGGDFVVQTPRGQLISSGGRFRVEVGRNRDVVSVDEGTVKVRDSRSEHSVSTGGSVVITADH
jgi:anti-sigma factor RsiW